MARIAMRKWICVGVLGGLLEFGIVYQVAFSDSDSPVPETVQASESNRRPKAGRKATRHLTSAAGSAGQAAADDTNAPAGAGANKPAAPAAPAPAAPGSPAAAGQPAPVVPPAADPLGVTLNAAVSAVAAVPAVLAQLTAPPASPAAPLPIDLNALLAGQAEAVQLAKIPPAPGPAPEPEPAPPIDLAKLPVEEMIRHVFGPDGEKAVEVARCESTMRTHAKRGQFLGLFQMGANERADYGHGPDALAQVKAAFALFQARGWQPWECA